MHGVGLKGAKKGELAAGIAQLLMNEDIDADEFLLA